MSKQVEGHGGDISQLDLRCSTACTRAGYLALVFSALALALLPPLALEKALTALGQYVVLRINLRDALERLDQDPCWQELARKNNPTVLDSNSLAKLLDTQCIYEGDLSQGHLKEPSPPPNPKNAAIGMPSPEEVADTTAPAAPTIIGISSPIMPIEEIDALMTHLGDGRVLTLGRSISSFNYPIYRWAMLRHQLRRLNIVALDKVAVIVPRGQDSSESNSVPDFSREDLHKYLTIGDIRKLANTEVPELRDFEREKGAVSAFSLPSVQVPLTSSMASTLVEAGLLLSLLYFWLYQQESQSSKSFPAQGTLFGALSRSTGARVLFAALIAVPPVTSFLLAYKSLPSYSYHYVNWIIAGCVLLAAFMIGWTSELFRRLPCRG